MSGAAKVQGWREVAELDDLVKEGVHRQVVKERKSQENTYDDPDPDPDPEPEPDDEELYREQKYLGPNNGTF